MMFKNITADDYSVFRPFFEKENYRISDYSIGCFYLWQELYAYTYAIIDGMLVFCGHDPDLDVDYYSYPLGDGDKSALILRLKEMCGDKFVLSMVPEEKYLEVKELLKKEGESFRNEEDYLYLASDLAGLPGKKYHTQRNHINYFKSAFKSECVPITADNKDSVLPLLDSINADKNGAKEVLLEERKEIHLLLRDYEDLGLVGAILKLDGEPIAFTIGEILGDTLIVHVEKAKKDVRGAYPYINQMFVQSNLFQITYVNREDDMGLDGLRKAKLEYHPVRLVKKYMF